MTKRVQTEKHRLNSERRLQWFAQAKYGIFVHWGLYSLPAGIKKDLTSLTTDEDFVKSIKRMLRSIDDKGKKK